MLRSRHDDTLDTAADLIEAVEAEDLAQADRNAWATLTGRERAVYDVLASHPGRVMSRAHIARAAGFESLSDRRCDTIISGLRRRLGEDAIATVRRRGWRLIA
jgi:DNA-binding response OmpR family regulator